MCQATSKWQDPPRCIGEYHDTVRNKFLCFDLFQIVFGIFVSGAFCFLYFAQLLHLYYFIWKRFIESCSPITRSNVLSISSFMVAIWKDRNYGLPLWASVEVGLRHMSYRNRWISFQRTVVNYQRFCSEHRQVSVLQKETFGTLHVRKDMCWRDFPQLDAKVTAHGRNHHGVEVRTTFIIDFCSVLTSL